MSLDFPFLGERERGGCGGGWSVVMEGQLVTLEREEQVGLGLGVSFCGGDGLGDVISGEKGLGRQWVARQGDVEQ